MTSFNMEPTEAPKLSRFGHHPDPIVDWEVEVENLHSGMLDRDLGLEETDDGYGWDMLIERIGPALEFGGNLPRDEGNVAANYLKLKQIDGWLISNRWRRTVSMPIQMQHVSRLKRLDGERVPQIHYATQDEAHILNVLESKRDVQREQVVAIEQKPKWVPPENWKPPRWTLIEDDSGLFMFAASVFLLGSSVGILIAWMSK